MKILVTGGAGFIGSAIVDRFVGLGHRVVVLDNFSTGTRRNLNPKARVRKADIRDARRVEAIFREERPRVVCHQAAIAEVVRSVLDPIPTLEVNVTGTVNLLRAAGEHKTRRFLFASTGGAIYGEPGQLPVSESAAPAPLSPYGLSKLLGEESVRFYSRYYGFEHVILRYPNVYGPRQNPNGEAGVVAIFGALIRAGVRPTIFGDGSKTRDYVHVADIVRANVLALRRGDGETINLGWGREVSDRTIFETLARHAGFSRAPIHAPFRRGEVRRIALSAARARRVLGWRPRIPLERGIRDYLESTRPDGPPRTGRVAAGG